MRLHREGTTGQSAFPGSGTLKRYANDKSKVEQILKGAEPWKEF